MTDATKTAIAHPASTIILLRPKSKVTTCNDLNNFEVLLLLRNKAVKFAGGSWVFPGGRIDQTDYTESPSDVYQAARTSAVRESKEEANLELNINDFHFFSHWTTPKAEKKRFATWFFIAQLDCHQKIRVDDSEIVDYQWLSPSAALALHEDKQLNILPPAYLSLLELSKFRDIETALEFINQRDTPHYLPNMIFHDETASILLNNDCSYCHGDINAKGLQHRLTLKDSVWRYINTIQLT